MNNYTAFHKPDVGHTPNGPTVNQRLQKVPRHLFRRPKLELMPSRLLSECNDM